MLKNDEEKARGKLGALAKCARQRAVNLEVGLSRGRGRPASGHTNTAVWG
jgi:hypothetical protein